MVRVMVMVRVRVRVRVRVIRVRANPNDPNHNYNHNHKLPIRCTGAPLTIQVRCSQAASRRRRSSAYGSGPARGCEADEVARSRDLPLPHHHRRWRAKQWCDVPDVRGDMQLYVIGFWSLCVLLNLIQSVSESRTVSVYVAYQSTIQYKVRTYTERKPCEVLHTLLRL